jgi:hypothetical protein
MTAEGMESADSNVPREADDTRPRLGQLHRTLENDQKGVQPMSRILDAVRSKPWTIVVVVLAASLSGGAASAGATSEIEGVWSFNGGEVAVHAVAGGKFEGVVVAPTKFAECTHKVGEHVWTEITQQPDGSFWGKHQWLFEKSCLPNPDLGPTAWRVLHAASGSRYLEVCFSEPGESQPTIAPNGTSANVSYNCISSSPTAPLPVVVNTPGSSGAEQVSFANTILLPKARACVRRGMLAIKIADPKRDQLKEVVIRIKKRKVADVRGVKRLEKGIVLKHLPSGGYTLKIVATTVLGQKLTGSRTYHSCKRHPGKAKLHGRRGHR